MKRRNFVLFVLLFLGVVCVLTLFGKRTAYSAGEAGKKNAYSEGLSDKDIEEYYFPEFYTGYWYPVLPGSSSWPYNNHQDMVDVCQIPSDELVNMSTEELFETVLLYPLLSDVYAYDDFSLGIDSIRKTFNGFDELCRREDRKECMINWLAEHREWFLNVQSSGNTFADNMMYTPRISFMILAETLEMGLNQEGNMLEIINGILSDGFEVTSLERNAEPVSYVGFSHYLPVSQQTVYTPRGGPMSGVTFNAAENWLFSDNVIRTVVLNDLSTEGKTYCSSSMYSRYNLYPDSGRNATVKYNCHSYAWYSSSSSNTNWINCFNTAGYDLVTLQNVNDGGKVVFCESYGGDVGPSTERKHSAVVISKIYHPVHYNTVNDLNMKSKWGMCGVYSHQLANCPYYYYGSTTYVSDQLFYD